MKSKKKILFIIPSLKAGGAERVMSFLAQNLDPKSYNAKLIILGNKSDSIYNVGTLKTLYLNKSRLALAIPSIFKILIKEKPNIVLGSIVHVNMLLGVLSLFFRQIDFIGREASVVSERKKFSTHPLLKNNLWMNFFYSRLSCIICQSTDMMVDFRDNLNINSEKLFVINNPITNSVIPFNQKKKSKIVKFITVGRLSPEKGHIRVLKGLSSINNYKFTYTVVGSGPMLEEIKNKAKVKGLMDSMRFIPYTNKVLELIGEHDYFLQGSYVEGFPNALLESCTTGTPVIAFNAPGGTKEIVTNGVNGYIINTQEEFIDLLSNLPRIEKLDRQQIIDSVYNKFNSEKIIKEYENLFESL